MKYNLEYVNKKSIQQVKELVNTNFFRDIPLCCQVYENAYIVPADMNSAHFHRGVLTEDGDIVQNSLLFEGFEPDWAKSVDCAKAVQKHESVIYLGWLEPVWGHVLTDCLKKLWFIETEICKQLLADCVKLVAVIPWNSRAQREIFDMVGIPLESIENVKELTRYDKVYVPDNSIVTMPDETRYYTKEYKAIVDRIVSKIPLTQNTGKFYFTRTSFSETRFWKRREHGEAVIEKTFERLGYKIVSPEKMTVKEALSLIYNCDSFASTEGSISHNALFCQEGTEVVIVRKVDYVNRWQLVINQVSDVNITYVDAHKSIISTGCLGPFYMCVTRELERFVGYKIAHIPHIIKPSFWWYLIQNRRVTKRLLSLLHLE